MGNEANLSDIQNAIKDVVASISETDVYDKAPVYGLKEILALKKAEQLRGIAKVFKVKKYSALKKSELIEAIFEKLTVPEITEAILNNARKEEIEFFTDALKTGYVVLKSKEYVPMYTLQMFGIACTFKNSDEITVVIPNEIREICSVKKILTSFEVNPSENDIDSYARAAVNLYGAVKLTTLISIIERYENCKLDKVSVKNGLISANESKTYILMNDYVVNRIFENDIQGLDELLKESANVVRYVPDKNEFLNYSSDAYYEKNLQNNNLVFFLENAVGNGETAKTLMSDVCSLIARGGTDEDCIMLMKFGGVKLNNEDAPEWKLTLLLQNTRAVTRMWKFRGCTHQEMQRAKKPERNEMCPCGSKMKYKKCCWGK